MSYHSKKLVPVSCSTLPLSEKMEYLPTGLPIEIHQRAGRCQCFDFCTYDREIIGCSTGLRIATWVMMRARDRQWNWLGNILRLEEHREIRM